MTTTLQATALQTERQARTRRGLSLRWRILLLMLFILLPALLLFTWYTIRFQTQSYEDLTLTQAETLANAGAATTAHQLEEAIATGQLTHDQVFDTNYQPFWTFDPTRYPDYQGDPATLTKYHTAYDAYTDQTLQSILDSYVNVPGTDVSFAIPVDINGYLPTHNTRWSSGDGSPATDRTKRIFNDPVGLRAAQNTEPVLTQVYLRPGTGETLWDISTPIYVNGQHWGAFRVGVELTQNQARVSAALGSIILGIVILAVVVVVSAIGLAQYISNPIVRLTNIAMQVATGDLNQQIHLPNRAEITVLAKVFNQMTAQLRELVSSLEQKVTARTEQLRASNDVGRAAVSILDTDQLLQEVVNLITNRFGFYYAAIFLTDPSGKWAVLREATGEAGRTLKEHGHRLEVDGQSMVGTALRTLRPRIALDVGDEAVRFANPLLPDTRSEIALPLVVGNRLLGALDVQSTQAAAFDETSAAVLQAMADQVAIALSNTVQFQQTQEALQNARRLNEVSMAVTQAEDAPSLLTFIVTRTLAGVDGAAIFLYGAEDIFGRWSEIEVGATWKRADDDLPLVAGTRYQTDQLPFLQAIKPNVPLVISDITTASLPANDRSILSAWNVRSLAGFDLKVGARRLGAILLFFHQPHSFTTAEQQILQTVTQQAAIVLRNQQLVLEAQATLRQIDEINRRLTGKAWKEYHAATQRALRKVNWRQAPTPEATVPTPATVAAPVVVNGVEIGALRLEDPTTPTRTWSPDDVALLEAIASEVSIALEKTRLIEETERRAQRETIINRITGRIRNARSVDEMLTVATQELRLATQVSRSVVEIQPTPKQAPPPGDGEEVKA